MLIGARKVLERRGLRAGPGARKTAPRDAAGPRHQTGNIGFEYPEQRRFQRPRNHGFNEDGVEHLIGPRLAQVALTAGGKHHNPRFLLESVHGSDLTRDLEPVEFRHAPIEQHNLIRVTGGGCRDLFQRELSAVHRIGKQAHALELVLYDFA